MPVIVPLPPCPSSCGRIASLQAMAARAEQAAQPGERERLQAREEAVQVGG